MELNSAKKPTVKDILNNSKGGGTINKRRSVSKSHLNDCLSLPKL